MTENTIVTITAFLFNLLLRQRLSASALFKNCPSSFLNALSVGASRVNCPSSRRSWLIPLVPRAELKTKMCIYMYFVNNKDAVDNFTAQTSDQHRLYCACFKIAELGIAADDIRQWFSHRLQNFIHDMDDAISGQIVSWRNTFAICSHNLQNRLRLWKYEMKKKYNISVHRG